MRERLARTTKELAEARERLKKMDELEHEVLELKDSNAALKKLAEAALPQ
jgi:hypothetical protein